MIVKRKSSVRTSPNLNEAPEITDRWVAEADLRRGNKLVRRGRPKLLNPRRLLSLRLPPEVIAGWKARARAGRPAWCRC